MDTKFFYMDEQYIDPKTYRNAHAPQRRPCVSLTGVLIPTDIHAGFRKRFYQAVTTALDIRDNVIPAMPEIHASDLFPGLRDEVKFNFLEEVVTICTEMNFRIFRVGYFETPQLISMLKDRRGILSVCFFGLLSCLKDELSRNEIWPVMETDNSPEQDRTFAGQIQSIDYLTSITGGKSMSIDNGNLGELLYSTKRSAYGTVTDCISYLLDARFLQSLGPIASPFKQKLAAIALKLEPLIVFNEIIEMKFESPPLGYISNGPIRYVVRVEPKD